MLIVYILLGASLLLWGRKLFWLFVGAAGFFTGLQLASQVIRGPEWIGIAIGILVGIVAALLAIFLKSIAIVVAGFLMGGSVLLSLSGWFNINYGVNAWVIYIIGGILGAILISIFFDWVVIVLSSLGGAALIVDSVPTAIAIRALIFVVLLTVGVTYQSRELKRKKK